MKDSDIGMILRICRERAGLLQQDLARMLKIDRALVSKYETGAKIPPYNIVIEWGRATGYLEFILMASAGDEAWKRKLEIEKRFAQMKAILVSA